MFKTVQQLWKENYFYPRLSLPKTGMLTLLFAVFFHFLPDAAKAQHVAFAPQKAFQQDVTVSLKEALTEIETIYKVSINYNSEIVQDIQVKKNPDAVNVEEALRNILQPINYKFLKIEDDTYVILSLEEEKETRLPVLEPSTKPGKTMWNGESYQPIPTTGKLNNLPIPVAPQEKTISGKVTDENQEGLPGVNVVVKGTSLGTVTNVNGDYRLSVPDNAQVLVFSSVGYITEEVTISNQSTININMNPDIQSLDEIVVIGYGTQERKEVTGAVVSVSSEQIKDQPVPNVMEALSGQVSGVQVQQVSGAPGSDPVIRIRGTGSISAGNEPLIVIDGYPVGQTNLSMINPSDIESIDILKDASAAAIYGSRGGNGVVMITTKRGKTGKSQLQLDAWTGFQEIPKSSRYNLLNAREYADLFIEGRNYEYVYREGGDPSDPNEVRPPNYTIPPEFQDLDALGEGTDWQEEIFQVAPMFNINLGASGGSEKMRYAVSGNYLTQKGVVIDSDFKRYALRVNLDGNLTEKLKLGFNLAPSYTITNEVKTEGQWFSSSILGAALVISPHFPVRYEDGTYSDMMNWWPWTGTVENPVKLARDIDDKTTELRLFSNMFLDYEIMEGLNLKVSLGSDINTARRNFFRPSTIGVGGPPPSIPLATAQTWQDVNWLNENTLTYNKALAGGHELNVLLGFTIQKMHLERSDMTATNFPNDQVKTLNAGQVTQGNTFEEEWSLLSYLGRFNYAFKDRYLLTAAIRRDGSSRFGSGNRWGVFPSVSAGWRVSEEPFMQDVQGVSNLKLRGSYGLTGNNSIPNYGSIGLLSSTNYISGSGTGNLVTGLSPASLSNPDLGWEKNRQIDVGIELGLFQGRLNLELDYYQRNTSDLLLNVPIPASLGFTQALVNIGEVKNKGWEISANSVNVDGAFRWTTDFNLFTVKNETVALGPEGDPINVGTHITEIGEPMGMFYGYHIIGIYDTQEEIDNNASVEGNYGSTPGDLWYEDVNGDGVINANDRTVIGNPWPDFVYGMTNTFFYKNLDFKIFFQGVQGNEIYSTTQRFIQNIWGTINSTKAVLERWHSPENPGNGIIPKASMYESGQNDQNSDRFIQDGSYLRIRNVTLGYSFPENLLNRLKLSNARLYASVQNLYTFTGYEGYNPEINTQGGDPLRPGTDNLGYPVPRIYSLGINLSF